MSAPPSAPLSLADLLPAAHIVLPAQCRGKKRAFAIAAGKLAEITGLDGKKLFRQLLQGESRGSSAIGGGGAIPHTHADIPQPRCLLMRLPAPIAYDAADAADVAAPDNAVQTLFFFIAPAAAGAAHLNLLSVFSHLLADDDFMQTLAAQSEATAIAAAIANWQANNRATLDAVWGAC